MTKKAACVTGDRAAAKKNIRPPAVRLIMIRHGNCLSVCGLRHSVQMPVSM